MFKFTEKTIYQIKLWHRDFTTWRTLAPFLALEIITPVLLKLKFPEMAWNDVAGISAGALVIGIFLTIANWEFSKGYERYSWEWKGDIERPFLPIWILFSPVLLASCSVDTFSWCFQKGSRMLKAIRGLCAAKASKKKERNEEWNKEVNAMLIDPLEPIKHKFGFTTEPKSSTTPPAIKRAEKE